MNRQGAGSKKSGTPQSSQKTLTTFLRPKLPLQAKEENRLPEPESAQRSFTKTLCAGDSSDEDDLALLGQILPVSKPVRRQFSHVEIRSPEKARPKSAVSPRARSSPPAKAPSFAGNFSLQALLADRESRNHEKAALAKLEDTPWTAKTISGNITRQKNDSEPSLDCQDTRFIGSEPRWSACDESPAKVTTSRELRRISKQLPKALMISSEEQFIAMASSGLLLDFVRFHGWSKFPGDMTRNLYVMLVQAQLMSEALNIARLVSTSPELNDATLLAIFEALGVRSPTSRRTETFFIERSTQAASQLRDLKVQLVLQALHSQIVKLSQGNGIVDQQILEKLILLASVLGQDCTYGPKIVIQVEALLGKCCELLQSQPHVLCRILENTTRITVVQVGIVRAIPTINSAIIEQMQMLSYCFLTQERSDGPLTPAQRLDKLLEHISQARPFHPIDESTSFRELKHKVALLNCATSVIPASLAAKTTSLIQQLQTLHGRIVDGKAAFIERSEAKAAIQRLADRLKYTLEAHKRVNIFDKFRQ